MAQEPLYLDNHLLGVSKPAGVPVVPDGSGDPALLDSWKQWLKEHFDKPGDVFLSVVHRLDRPVSGVVLFARTSKAAGRLARQWREGSVSKIYHAVVVGRPPGDAGCLEQWLRKDAARNRVAVVGEPLAAGEELDPPKLARTRWRVLHHGTRYSLLELAPQTGRPHQLRVACAALGTPIAGDLKYGAPAPLSDRSIALHALRLEFDHPTRGERLQLETPPPRIFRSLAGGAE